MYYSYFDNILSEITRLNGAKSALEISIESKGVDVSDEATLDEYSRYVNNIESGSDGLTFDDAVMRNFSEAYGSATKIGSYAFSNCYDLTTASYPNCTSIGMSAFHTCDKLTSVNFPICEIIDANAFSRCTQLTTINFPICTKIGNDAFNSCWKLPKASFPNCTRIGDSAFYACYNLISLYLIGSSVCTLATSRVFASTPIGGYSKSAGTYGSIYVPASLLTQYQTSTNWSYYSSRFVGI